MVYHLLPRYVIGVDLGQVADFSAVVVAERTPERLSAEGSYELIHVERLPLGTSYVEIPGRLRAIIEQTQMRWSTLAAERGRALPMTSAPIDLLIDRTGVGRGVFDFMCAQELQPIGVVIHGGSAVVQAAYNEWHTPKRDLVAATQILLQTRRLKWAPTLPGTEVLRAELENFRAKISASGHDSYAAGTVGGDDWRQGANDDVVLSVSMAAWYGERSAVRGSMTASTSYLDEGEDEAREPVWFSR